MLTYEIWKDRKLTDENKYVVLLDLERSVKTGMTFYWKPRRFGYTVNINQAGIYDKRVAEKIINDDVEGNTVAIGLDIVHNILI